MSHIAPVYPTLVDACCALIPKFRNSSY